jgi:transmembrane sensor
MKPESDDLSSALEQLRNRPIVTESRDYARRWERSRARTMSLRTALSGPVGAIAAACVTAWVIFGPLPPMVGPAAKKLFATGVGETRAIALEDGSRIVLDTNSRLRVVFTAAARDIELLDGRAHFEVAKDVRRPFRVRTKSAEVVAVGTMFDVATLAARTTVTLIDGRVNVLTISATPQARPTVEELSPGQQLGIASDGELLGTKTVKLESVTAWQRGMVVLDDMPLPEALAAVNRYATTQIVIADQRLQARRVSGVFRIGDVETEASVLRRYFDLRERSRSEWAIVLEPANASRPASPRSVAAPDEEEAGEHPCDHRQCADDQEKSVPLLR